MPKNRSRARREQLREEAQERRETSRLRDYMHDLVASDLRVAKAAADDGWMCILCDQSKGEIMESGESLNSHGEFPHSFEPMPYDMQLRIEANRAARANDKGHHHMCPGKRDETCPYPNVTICHAIDGISAQQPSIGNLDVA